MNLINVIIDEIAWEDRSFEIRSFRDNSRLHGSLARHGILDPPWILKKGGKHIIVDGFKRLFWARDNGTQAVNCLLLPENLASREIWERRIEAKIFERDLDLAEKVRAASVLMELYPGGDAPVPLLSALNIPPRGGTLAKWARLFADGPETLKILGSGDIAERTALEVSDWDPESRRAVLTLLCSLRCSASIQVEIVQRLDEVAIREEKSRLDILNDTGIRKILADEKLNHRQKTQSLRDFLTRLRYPRLSRRESKFQEDVKSLSLPSAIRIVPPPAFEGDGWKMEISFAGPDELRKALKDAGETADSGRLDRIFEPVREEKS